MIVDSDLYQEMLAWGHTAKVRRKTRTGGDPKGDTFTTADSAAYPVLIQPMTAEEMENNGRLGINANYRVFAPVFIVADEGFELKADDELVGVTPAAYADWVFQIMAMPLDIMPGGATTTEGRHLEIAALVVR